jgi:hypothetical protein
MNFPLTQYYLESAPVKKLNISGFLLGLHIASVDRVPTTGLKMYI